ncbi:MAG: PQQ-like beta-propeller repeat protein [Desulfobacteraceae bacterium]|nr:PQQ-like beta-propeller repeat protein [Desulfobacteraceae bacterium]
MKLFRISLIRTMLLQISLGGQHVVVSERKLSGKRLLSLLNLDTPGMQNVQAAAVACFLSLMLVSSRAVADDWPGWRGPNHDGVAEGMKLPNQLPESLQPVWKVEVGEGHSAPVVAGNKVVVFVRQGENEVVLCLNAEDGQEMWRYSYPAPYTPRADARPHGKGSKSTPTIAADKVYAFGVTGILSCVELKTGELLWQKRFSDRFEKTYPLYGAANSPLIEGELCILGIGGHNDGALAAFNKDTGELVWQVTGDGPSYASPITVDLSGQRQVVALMQSRLVGVAAKTGQLLWQVPFTTAHDMNIITPVFHEGMIVYSGYRKGTTAVRLVKAGDRFTPEPVWNRERFSMYMSSPVIHGDYLYGLSQERSAIGCLGWKDGELKWFSPGGVGQYASIVRAGDRLLVLTTKGRLMLVAADPLQYKELGRTHVTDKPVWAHLALAANRIYVKDKTHLACFELPAPVGNKSERNNYGSLQDSERGD